MKRVIQSHKDMSLELFPFSLFNLLLAGESHCAPPPRTLGGWQFSYTRTGGALACAYNSISPDAWNLTMQHWARIDQGEENDARGRSKIYSFMLWNEKCYSAIGKGPRVEIESLHVKEYFLELFHLLANPL